MRYAPLLRSTVGSGLVRAWPSDPEIRARSVNKAGATHAILEHRAAIRAGPRSVAAVASCLLGLALLRA
eukprot:1062609-Alexandrium_andersonii.AAC.1